MCIYDEVVLDGGLPDLGELEREVMDLVWQHAPVTAEQLRNLLPRAPKESTVRTVLKRLEAKALIAHTTEGRTFVYTAAVPRRAMAARAVRKLVDWFRVGSVNELLVGMADAEMIDRAQLEALLARIDQAEKDRQP